MFERGIFLGVLVLPIICGCDSLLLKMADKEVEIAPDEWITVKQLSSQLAIPRGDKTLMWKEEEDETPVSLREWEDKLYLITFDRSDMSKIRFRFYAENGEGFNEIEPDAFPRRIATQNLWLETNNGVRRDGSVINEVQIARDLDPSDYDFQRSLTAKIWMQLESGKECYEIGYDDVEQSFLEEYTKRHTVIGLTTIQR